MTQAFVASHVGLNRVSLAQIEAGKRKVSADELGAFCGLYGVSADYLLFGKGQQDDGAGVNNLKLLNDKDRSEITDFLNFLVFRKIKSYPEKSGGKAGGSK